MIAPITHFRTAFVRASIILALLLLAPLSQAQNPVVDSLFTLLNASEQDTNRVLVLSELCWEYALIDLDSAIQFGDEAIELANQLDYKSGAGTAHRYIGRVYYLMEDSENEFIHRNAALSIAEELDDQGMLAKAHNDLASSYQIIGELDKALVHFIEGIHLLEEAGNYFGASQLKLNMSYIYFEHGELRKVVESMKEVRAVFNEAGDEMMVAIADQISGSAYKDLGESENALNSFRKALIVYEKYGDVARESEALSSIGSVYHELGEYEKALDYYNRSLTIDDSLGYTYNVTISYYNLGALYIEMGDPEKGVEAFERSIEIAKESDRLPMLSDLMAFTAIAYAEKGEYKKAFEFQQRREALKDTTFSAIKSQQLIEIKEAYEAEQREQKIISLMTENEAIEAKANLRSTLLVSATALLVFIVVVVVLYLKQRKSQEERRRLKLEQKALRAQMNPHFIFNSLNSIQRLFIEEKHDLANDYMGDFGSLLRTILENSGKASISVKDELDTLKLYLDLEMMRTDGLVSYKMNIDPTLDQLNNFVPPLIIQPFVENAIWHGILPTDRKGLITIDLKRHNDTQLICTVTDDGVGIEQSKSQKEAGNHNSKGMGITEERLGLMNAVRAEELSSGGTKITIIIPLIS